MTLDELQRLSEQATPGPWDNTGIIGRYIEGRYEWTSIAMPGSGDRENPQEVPANAAYICAACTMAPRMIKALRLAEQELINAHAAIGLQDSTALRAICALSNGDAL